MKQTERKHQKHFLTVYPRLATGHPMLVLKHINARNQTEPDFVVRAIMQAKTRVMGLTGLMVTEKMMVVFMESSAHRTAYSPELVNVNVSIMEGTGLPLNLMVRSVD